MAKGALVEGFAKGKLTLTLRDVLRLNFYGQLLNARS
jgi:hypothetical protein